MSCGNDKKKVFLVNWYVYVYCMYVYVYEWFNYVNFLIIVLGLS